MAMSRRSAAGFVGAEELTERYSELDRALEQLAEERSSPNIESPSADAMSTRYQPAHADGWLHRAEGILVLRDSSLEHRAVKEIQPADLLAEGWTVGIGFHCVVQIAAGESSTDPLLTTVQQPADRGAIFVRSDDTKRDELLESAKTDSTNPIVGVAICVVGIHYLRARKQARRASSGSCQRSICQLSRVQDCLVFLESAAGRDL